MTRIYVGNADGSPAIVGSIAGLRSLFSAGVVHVSFEWDGEWHLERISQVIGVLSEMVGIHGDTLESINWVCESASHQDIIKEFLS